VSQLDQATKVIRFGVFEVDLRTAELRKQGVRVRLSGQSFQVLEALLLRPGELVTREELKQKLWPTDNFGDFEHGLNAAVNRVREALGDSSDNPRFVETIPRRGYRFIAQVDNGIAEANVPPEAAPAPSQNGQEPTTADVASQPAPALRRRWIPAAVALVLLISAGALLFLRFRDRQSSDGHSASQQDLRPVPLTTLPGQEVSPSFSPDGSQVAFAWDGGNSSAPNPFNLYVKAIGSENIEQLTHEPADFIVPAWSPDGSTIAFARKGGEKPGVFSVPARGGAERKLADASLDQQLFISLSWSPDGRQLVYYTVDGLRVLAPESGEVRTVETPGCDADAPAFSPDGKWIAFTCRLHGDHYLDLLSLKGGTTKHLLKGWDCQTAWTNDSQRIVITGAGGGIWEININGGEPRRLISAENALRPAVASRGNRLAYMVWQSTTNVWQGDTRTGLTRSAVAPSIVEQRDPDISPEGKRIAFESERSGFHEIWVANLDGSDAVQLSNFRMATGTGSPEWSPDGRKIAFDSRVTGKASLYVVDPTTALPKQISTNGIPAMMPRWSADGNWIYFTSASPEPAEIEALYRVRSQGGIPERVAQARGYNAQQSKDGHLLYFAAGQTDTPIKVLNVETGEQHGLAGMPTVGDGNDWVLGSNGIFFVVWGSKPGVDFYDFSSQRVTRRLSFDRQPDWWGGLSLSPDETWLAYSQVDQSSSHLMLVEGFR